MKVRIKDTKTFLFTIEDNISDIQYNDVNKNVLDLDISYKITEFEFYCLFILIRESITKIKDKEDANDNIGKVNIEYLATIMCKNLDYTLPVKGRTKLQKDLAEERGRNSQSVYNAIYRLKKAGYLIITEDGLITPNDELQVLRKVTKAHLEKIGYLPVSYLMNIIVFPDANS